jgi:hypothetical protein
VTAAIAPHRSDETPISRFGAYQRISDMKSESVCQKLKAQRSKEPDLLLRFDRLEALEFGSFSSNMYR